MINSIIFVNFNELLLHKKELYFYKNNNNIHNNNNLFLFIISKNLAITPPITRKTYFTTPSVNP